MTPGTLPFAPAKSHGDVEADESCPLYRLLPAKLQEESRVQRHLWDYLHTFPVEEFGIPEYHEKLARSLGDLPDPNLIYPVGRGLFVHICSDPGDSRNHYIIIEPGMMEDMAEIMGQVELRLVDHIHEMEKAESTTDRAQLLLKAVEKVVTVAEVGSKSRASEKEKAHKKSNAKVILSPSEAVALRYLIVRDKEGMGILETLIVDTNIEDISCSGLGPIFVEHKIFKSLKASISFRSMEELDAFVLRLSEKIGKPVTFRDPVVDAVLPDGSRINIVFGVDVSKRGSNFTIRKFSTTPLSVFNIIDGGGMDYRIAAYMSLIINHGMNVFVSGETASGKTTLLNALTTFVGSNGKIVTIEDTPELQVPHPNWIRESTRGTVRSGGASAVTMFDLLKAALRQRPNAILIGEIRGEEGAIAFQAMQTGHACMATFHAASVEKLIQRLTGNPINVPKTYVDNLNVVCIQSMVRLPNGKDGRRVISVNEIVGYDSSADAFSFIEVFRWDPVKDVFEFTGNNNSYLLEERIAMRRGLPAQKKRQIYDELNRRANILKRLHEQKISDFYALYQILAKAHRQGIFR